MIQAVIFDFDGTLVLSNDIKRSGFFRIASAYPRGEKLMREILDAPDAGDRHNVLRTFAEQVHCSRDAAEKSVAFVEQYTFWCKTEISTCPERPGASKALCQLFSAGMTIYVNSATPKTYLSQIIAQRYTPSLFSGVYGGPETKCENLITILRSKNIAAAETITIGDGLDDKAAADQTGGLFIGVAGGTLEAEGHYVGDLLNEINLLPDLIRALETKGTL